MTLFVKRSLARRILFVEAFAFLFLFLLLWVDELLDVPFRWFGAPHTPINWRESVLESCFVLILAALVLFYTGLLLRKLNSLEGILPICASCKKIRDDDGDWQQIEAYIRDRSQAEFSHSICPDCKKNLYYDYLDDDERS